MSCYNIDDLTEVSLSNSLMIKVVPREKSTLLLAKLAKGGKVLRHKPIHELVTYILKGAINFSVGESSENASDYVVREGKYTLCSPTLYMSCLR